MWDRCRDRFSMHLTRNALLVSAAVFLSNPPMTEHAGPKIKRHAKLLLLTLLGTCPATQAGSFHGIPRLRPLATCEKHKFESHACRCKVPLSGDVAWTARFAAAAGPTGFIAFSGQLLNLRYSTWKDIFETPWSCRVS